MAISTTVVSDALELSGFVAVLATDLAMLSEQRIKRPVVVELVYPPAVRAMTALAIRPQGWAMLFLMARQATRELQSSPLSVGMALFTIHFPVRTAKRKPR